MSQSHARSGPRPPVWVWVVAGVLAVGLAATAALLLSNRGGGPEPEAEVITLPLPTPTVEAITREPGTAFYDALPATAAAFALAGTGEAPTMLAAGALEAYRLDYTDGAATVTALAGQWPDADEATAAMTALLAPIQAAAPTAEPTEDATDEPTEAATTGAATDEPTGSTATPTPLPTEGTVEVDGQPVGSWVLVAGADGAGTLIWTNQTVVVQLDGPIDALRDVYAAFAL